MRSTLAFVTASLALVLSSASSVAADAIDTYPGVCPPGLDRAISSHMEVCAPRACTSDAQCGEGAACRPIAECWAPREVRGREAPEGATAVLPIGECRADGTCAEGECRRRSQCEPTRDTSSWDRSTRRWTGESYTEPSCSVAAPGARSTGALVLVAMLSALAVLVRRRTSSK